MGRIVRADVGKGKRLSNTFQEGAGFDQFTVVHPTIYFYAPCYDLDKAERSNFNLRDQFVKIKVLVKLFQKLVVSKGKAFGRHVTLLLCSYNWLCVA